MSGNGERDEDSGRIAAGAITPAMRRLASQLGLPDDSSSSQIQQVSADVYLSTRRFAAEREVLFAKLPVPLLPSACLNPGQSTVHDHYGVPLVVTRDRDGAAHVLMNVCQHRGTRLVEASGVQTVSRLVCPYHSWTYALNGTLKGLPRPDTFPELDKGQFNLRSFPVDEGGGMIWTRLDRQAFDISESLGDIAADFDALGLGQASVFNRNTHTVKANWKLIMDAFLESYHVQRLHGKTIAPFFEDSITASDRAGIHFRSAVARQGYAESVNARTLDELRNVVTFSYSVLPGMVVVASPDYVNVMLLYPQNTDCTIVEDYMLISGVPQDDEEIAHWEESFALLDGGVFAAEDFRAAELGHQGLMSGGIEHLTLGTAEDGVAQLHKTLASLLALNE